MGRFDSFCQSCGMPLDQDPGKGGTEADGSKNAIYCSYCYDKGQFRDNYTDARQMVTFAREKLKEMGFGWIKRWLFTLHVPQLARWKKKW
ncbi:MAG: zinc ribbon domain-containing protein [Saprospiraceae bacterium]|nr:zinc ribbon domain-containing protein [Saprospiraceae bacterium]